ncbi:MAG TPA: hypothetical protein VHY35_01845 [Stellaceae bacterium]|jgi:capsular polysaccharide export protein|nr:hypothetical protein [Stellaceae bacterium]
MDGFPLYTHDDAGSRSADAPKRRSFLFLQGPISTFFNRLGHALVARGHHVHRVNLHFGDQIFWKLPATHFRGRFADWRRFVARILDEHRITDLVLHGDRRPYHLIAAEEARARGIRVIATDLGYIRPDWITLEHDGMTTYSRFPRDPDAIRALAREFPEPDLGPRFHTPFRLIASLDVAYNLGLVFGRPLYPSYRYHSVCHPFVEYAGWLTSRVKRRLTARTAAARRRRLETAPGSYFLVPLQLATDFQIRAHSPFRDIREAVRQIIASYAASDAQRDLVVVVHPLDNGLIGWSAFVAGLAREFGVADRVVTLHGGTPSEILGNAAGVVTINSTIGVTALHHGVPVKVLGNAVFDVPGLTCQAPLDAFWSDPQPPDPELLADFLRALAGATQVKGGYYERASQDCAIAGFVERLEGGLYPLPALSAADFAARAPRPGERTIVVAGASDALGSALARACAAPGIRLCLIGTMAGALDQVADDCRQRGALVEAIYAARNAKAALSARLTALDCGTPIDVAFVHTDGPAADRRLLKVIDTLTAAMRRRGRGELILIDQLAGRPLSRRLGPALQQVDTLRSRGVALHERLRDCGVTVSVVVPGRLALHAARWLGALHLTAGTADRIAEQILQATQRRRRVTAIPGSAAATLRVFRWLPGKLGEATRELLPSVEVMREPADRSRLAGKSANGD